jgi:hypothetical protein
VGVTILTVQWRTFENDGAKVNKSIVYHSLKLVKSFCCISFFVVMISLMAKYGNIDRKN